MTKVKVVTGSDRNFFEKLLTQFPSGSTIFEEGDLGTTMYIIQKGKVEIRKNIGGAEQVLSILEKGDFFGEMSILEGSPRSASAHALDDVEALEIDEATDLLKQLRRAAERIPKALQARAEQLAEALPPAPRGTGRGPRVRLRRLSHAADPQLLVMSLARPLSSFRSRD